jgi:hypothetical protein
MFINLNTYNINNLNMFYIFSEMVRLHYCINYGTGTGPVRYGTVVPLYIFDALQIEKLGIAKRQTRIYSRFPVAAAAGKGGVISLWVERALNSRLLPFRASARNLR